MADSEGWFAIPAPAFSYHGNPKGAQQTPESRARPHRASESSQFPSASVLVVDDDEDTRFMLRTFLEARGANVIEAKSGEMAIALAANIHLDLILMDGSLPLLDGWETTRRIRELGSTSGDVPIVFLSGHAQPDARAKALAAGCTDYLVKPIDFAAWDSLLEQHLTAGKRLR